MRLAIIRQRYTPFGGAERFVEAALEALLERNVAITLYTREWPETRIKLIEPRIVDPFYIGSLWRDYGFARAVSREVGRAKLDLVQSHERLLTCDVYRAGDGVHAVWLAERLKGAPWWKRLSVRLNPWHRYVLSTERKLFASPLLQAVICNSAMVRDEIRQAFRVPDEKLRLIYNAVDSQLFSPALRDARTAVRAKLRIADDAIVYLFVGSGFERKGVATAIAALAEQPPPAHLVIVGRDKHLQRYAALAKRLGVGSRVTLTGPLADPKPFFGAADVFVLPTIYDPFPNAALEAMATGLPVITTHEIRRGRAARRARRGFRRAVARRPCACGADANARRCGNARADGRERAQCSAASDARGDDAGAGTALQGAARGERAAAEARCGAQASCAPRSMGHEGEAAVRRAHVPRPRRKPPTPHLLRHFPRPTTRSRRRDRRDTARARSKIASPSRLEVGPQPPSRSTPRVHARMSPGLHLYLRLLHYVRPYWWAFAIAFVGHGRGRSGRPDHGVAGDTHHPQLPESRSEQHQVPAAGRRRRVHPARYRIVRVRVRHGLDRPSRRLRPASRAGRQAAAPADQLLRCARGGRRPVEGDVRRPPAGERGVRHDHRCDSKLARDRGELRMDAVSQLAADALDAGRASGRRRGDPLLQPPPAPARARHPVAHRLAHARARGDDRRPSDRPRVRRREVRAGARGHRRQQASPVDVEAVFGRRGELADHAGPGGARRRVHRLGGARAERGGAARLRHVRVVYGGARSRCSSG